ncbi:MAG: methylated-DNA--[protein]-cysteine S-methyltransferase [Bacteroidia bacterium]|nr:MAG: methylated-DNA--[protein]-cysteine S-methyltransferase [Bacteroidia bacterium]
MDRIQTTYYKTPFGELILGSMEHQLCLCDWRFRKMRTSIDERIQSGLKATYAEEGSDIIEETQAQLSQYFSGERKQFDLPLLLVGSEFQKQVWNELIRIPFGKTESYADLSKKLGNIEAIRAVASANGANAISIIVPCHRILGSDGSLTGYAGGLATKKKLLQLEKAFQQGELPLGF